MSKRVKFQAKVKGDLLQRLRDYFTEDGDIASDDGCFDGPDLIALCNRIQGQEVTLILSHGDAFEINDDRFWLPDCTWDRIP